MPLSELLEAVLPYLQGGGQEALPQSTNSLPLPSQEALPQSTNSLPLPSQEGLPRGPNSPALEVGAPEADDWSDVVQMALYEKNLLEVQNQKETLAELIRPLVSEEALRQNYRREKLPSETFIVEQLISRILAGKKCTQPATSLKESIKKLSGIKKFLACACQNARDETKGRTPIRTEIKIIILDYIQRNSENHPRQS